MQKYTRKYRLPLNLQLFSDEGAVDTGVESASDAGMPAIEGSQSDSSAQSGVDTSADAGQVKDEKDFAKAMRAKEAHLRKQIESEYAEKYKDYDTHKELSSYFQQINGLDAMTLKERIEMERLQERAEKENVPPEVLKRLDELEAKAAKVDEFEQQQQQQQWQQTYFTGLNEFVKDRGVEADKLNQFMIDNEFTVNPEDMNKSFELAYKAMKYDDVVKQSEEAEKNGMKKLLQAKGSIPTVPGSSAQGQVVRPPAKTWAEARARAYQRGAE